MARASKGDRVRVQYSGYIKDGMPFDSSSNNEPVEFIIGQGSVVPGLENAVIGMEEGEKRSVMIPPEDAYGHHKIELVTSIDSSRLPPEIHPEIGMKLQARTKEGLVTTVTVTEMTDDYITLDGNHPLAGEELIFEIKLLEIL